MKDEETPTEETPTEEKRIEKMANQIAEATLQIRALRQTARLEWYDPERVSYSGGTKSFDPDVHARMVDTMVRELDAWRLELASDLAALCGDARP